MAIKHQSCVLQSWPNKTQSVAAQKTFRSGVKKHSGVSMDTASHHVLEDFGQIPIVAPAAIMGRTSLVLGKPQDEYEQEAERISDEVMRMSEPKLQGAQDRNEARSVSNLEPSSHQRGFLQMVRSQSADAGQTAAPPKIYQTLQSPGQPLDSATRDFMQPRFGHDFSMVRVHADSEAADAARTVGARAFTVGQNIVFGQGEFAPATEAGNRLLAHELTHVVQQRVQGTRLADVVQRAPSTLESSTSASERQNVRMLRSELIAVIPPNEIKDLMTDKGADSVPADTVTFSPEIAAKIQRGLQNVAARIFNEKGFTYNTVTNLPMNLQPYGGVNGVYRFTLARHQKTSKGELIIEQVSDTPPADWQRIDLAAHAKRFESFGFKLGIGFESDEMKKRLFGALARVPDKFLTRVRGLTFNKHMADKGSESEPAHYDPNTHSIDLFGKTIVESMNRVDDAGGGDWFTAVVTHEVGHAVDDESYTNARMKRDAIVEQLKAAKLKARQLKVDVNAPIPDERADADKEKNERHEMQRLEDELAKAESEFDKATEQDRSKSKEFTKARGKAISSYGEKGKDLEDFAELFSVFVLDPKLLKSLRPDAFDYFSKTFS
jgi:hypothetical protein